MDFPSNERGQPLRSLMPDIRRLPSFTKEHVNQTAARDRGFSIPGDAPQHPPGSNLYPGYGDNCPRWTASNDPVLYMREAHQPPYSPRPQYPNPDQPARYSRAHQSPPAHLPSRDLPAEYLRREAQHNVWRQPNPPPQYPLPYDPHPRDPQYPPQYSQYPPPDFQHPPQELRYPPYDSRSLSYATHHSSYDPRHTPYEFGYPPHSHQYELNESWAYPLDNSRYFPLDSRHPSRESRHPPRHSSPPNYATPFPPQDPSPAPHGTHSKSPTHRRKSSSESHSPESNGKRRRSAIFNPEGPVPNPWSEYAETHPIEWVVTRVEEGFRHALATTFGEFNSAATIDLLIENAMREWVLCQHRAPNVPGWTVASFRKNDAIVELTQNKVIGRDMMKIHRAMYGVLQTGRMWVGYNFVRYSPAELQEYISWLIGPGMPFMHTLRGIEGSSEVEAIFDQRPFLEMVAVILYHDNDTARSARRHLIHEFIGRNGCLPVELFLYVACLCWEVLTRVYLSAHEPFTKTNAAMKHEICVTRMNMYKQWYREAKVLEGLPLFDAHRTIVLQRFMGGRTEPWPLNTNRFFAPSVPFRARDTSPQDHAENVYNRLNRFLAASGRK